DSVVTGHPVEVAELRCLGLGSLGLDRRLRLGRFRAFGRRGRRDVDRRLLVGRVHLTGVLSQRASRESQGSEGPDSYLLDHASCPRLCVVYLEDPDGCLHQVCIPQVSSRNPFFQASFDTFLSLGPSVPDAPRKEAAQWPSYTLEVL